MSEEKAGSKHVEDDSTDIAEVDGSIATDRYGQRCLVPHDTLANSRFFMSRSSQPTMGLDPSAESRLRLKIDLYIIPVVSMMYLFCFIDRASIGNAKLAGLEEDLGLTSYDYNTLLSVFYISYIIFEIPSNLVCKWLGPGWVLPALTLGFGICSLCTAFVHNLSSAAGVRFLLGVFEAGILPGISYYLSRWYRKRELAFRISMYMVMSPLAGAFGGLLASGILKLSSFGGLKDWRMIFAIEGIATIGVAIITFLTLTDRPETARWLTQEEKDLAIARIRSESEYTGAAEVLDKLDVKKTMRGIFSPVTLVTSWIMLLVNVTVQGLAFFAPTIVRTIYPRHSVISQQLHTVPPYIIGAVSTLLIPYLSSRFNRRLLFFVLAPPLMMAGYVMFLASSDPHVRYGATFLIAFGSFPVGVLCNAHAAANVISDTARASAIGTVVMLGNIGGLVSTWSFLPFDAPNYYIGNGLNLATGAMTLLTAVCLWLWTVRDNKRRDNQDTNQVLDEMTGRQAADLEWRHPRFRWRL
ncbi:major facilitator superfamily domain-containing protein [Aspergillus bertholletiae]|uniref:Major facilitator superfamily domain-containing protein n=1 Tax=Aspergillus bertholletiae TaxID=1226010 RepID=A0A5N7B6E4_9EURO|nr:major facilitator superfamily domain-containing protein [Aspergillus bertholletiae]